MKFIQGDILVSKSNEYSHITEYVFMEYTHNMETDCIIRYSLPKMDGSPLDLFSFGHTDSNKFWYASGRHVLTEVITISNIKI